MQRYDAPKIYTKYRVWSSNSCGYSINLQESLHAIEVEKSTKNMEAHDADAIGWEAKGTEESASAFEDEDKRYKAEDKSHFENSSAEGEPSDDSDEKICRYSHQPDLGPINPESNRGSAF